MASGTGQDGDERARQIMAESRRVYEECDSYMDVGLHHGSIGVRDETPFVTYFQRPDRFRFEYLHCFPFQTTFSIRGVIVRSEPGPARLWQRYDGQNELSEELEIKQAIASFTGVSHATSHRVPWQLLRLPPGRWEYQLLGDRWFDGHLCHCVSTCDAEPRLVWIDCRSLLVRRAEWHCEHPSVTIYRPALNPPASTLPPGVFQFDPTAAGESPLGDGEGVCRELRPLIGEMPEPQRDDRFDDWPTDVD